MLIIPWDLFSMKKLLKNEICGSVNSVRRKVKKLWLKREKKKKKKKKLKRKHAFGKRFPNTP